MQYLLQHPGILCSHLSQESKVDELEANTATQKCNLQTIESRMYKKTEIRLDDVAKYNMRENKIGKIQKHIEYELVNVVKEK